MKNLAYRKCYPVWKHNLSTGLKKRRLLHINRILDGRLLDKAWLNGKRILEIGCASGADFIQFFKEYQDVDITGIDISHYDIQQSNVTFMVMDAEKTPFEDKQFDFTVSIGVLEHIQPVEKLCRVIAEIDRISKEYVVLVPSISTFLEPHTGDFFWQLRPRGRKRNYNHLNYYSDDAWLQFGGFSGAKITRFGYIPLLIENSIIYRVIERGNG